MYLEHLVPQALAIAAAPRCFMHRLRHPELVSFGLLANLVRLSRLPQFRRFDAVIDVGANIGQFAYMAHVAWPGVPVHSFEPDPEAFVRLTANAAHFGIAGTRHAVAAASYAGRADLNLQPDRVNNSLLARAGEPAVAQVEVQCATLDEALSSVGALRHALLKLDTQGTELDVLRGASATVRGAAAILVEAAVQPAYEGAAFLGDLLHELRGLGFVLFDLVDVLRMPRVEGHGLRELDLLFVPAS